jgi:hypothetical protein
MKEMTAKTTIVDSGNNKFRQRVLVATPTLGLVRMEWVGARYNQVIPTNWSKTDMIQYMNGFIPLRYTVADAQNLAVKACLEGGFEWLMFIEDDTMPPPDGFLRFTEYMDKADIPVVSGLYFTRSVPPEPMVYRGRGTHYFRDWKLEDKVWVDGVPTGMLIIHANLLKAVYDDSPDYHISNSTADSSARRVFNSPAQSWFNEETGAQETLVGTSDLDFCSRVIKGDYLTKAGFPEIAKKKYPFLIDTNIYCKHVEKDGRQFPLEFPKEFLPDDERGAKEIID